MAKNSTIRCATIKLLIYKGKSDLSTDLQKNMVHRAFCFGTCKSLIYKAIAQFWYTFSVFRPSMRKST